MFPLEEGFGETGFPNGLVERVSAHCPCVSWVNLGTLPLRGIEPILSSASRLLSARVDCDSAS